MADGKRIENGSIVMEDGKISALVANYAPRDGDEIIHAEGLFIAPGLIDPHTHVSVWNEGMGPPGFDGNEMTDPLTPFLRAIDAVWHDDLGFTDALEGGITTIAVTAGSANVIGGEVAALKTKPGTLLDKLIAEPIAMKMALGENPKRCYGTEKKQTPSTRMGNAYLMRKALLDAQNYLAKWEAFGKIDTPILPPDKNLGHEAIARVLRREIPAKIHCHRADDIVTACRIAEEFNIRITIDHCTEGHLIVDFLKERKPMCIVGPVITSRSKVELKERDASTTAVLYKAGVPVALTTDHPVIPIQHFLLQVEIAVQHGLPLEAALDIITVNAATAMGLEDRIGALKEGYDADIVLLTSPPGAPDCRVMKTIIDGDVVWER